jgi:hypothetical protein
MKSVVVSIVSSVIACLILIPLFLLNLLYEIQCIEEGEENNEQHETELEFTGWLWKILVVTFFYFKHQLLYVMMIHSDIEVMAKYFQLADRNISISSQKC